MKYQKDFPELLQEHTEKNFVIDNRILWEHLGKPYDKYNHWFNRKVRKQGWTENVDYITRWKKIHLVNDGFKELENQYFTVESAKHIALSENSAKGKEVRSYFILLERAVRDMEKWILVRNPEKEGYKQLCEAVNSNYKLTHNGKEANIFVYSNEADMINECLLGAKAKQIRLFLEIEDDKTRDNLTIQINQTLYELQLVDIALIIGQIDFKQRKSMLENLCNTKYKHISLAATELEQVV
ncbi:antA/AntB antirepressor family protein [Paenibacillus sp. LK1]|uniref:antA/AntB antirepressor family protein n=1 Tax=Paenibacillus sp. LK1 TaxID=2053014 RepID=UPI000C18E9D8|nr:antA/AntB antirepressor family protein [Paenibacillus sp. LK1]PIH59099.1 hypothetical protein CS562_14255 [Paenibacillus sp. LK1]